MPAPNRNKRKRSAADMSGAASRRRESIGPESPQNAAVEQQQQQQQDVSPSPTLPQQQQQQQTVSVASNAPVTTTTANTTATASVEATATDTTATIPPPSSALSTPKSSLPPPNSNLEIQKTETAAVQPSKQSTSKAPKLSTARIQSLLLHRKLLLQRLQQGRTACQSRISTLPPPPPDEVAAFAQNCRQATSLARKQARSASTTGENEKSSFSLRRGSSVGKRMNAALHTLAPPERSTTPHAQQSQQQQQHQQQRQQQQRQQQQQQQRPQAPPRNKRPPQQQQRASSVPPSMSRSATAMSGATTKVPTRAKAPTAKVVVRQPRSTPMALLRDRRRQLQTQLSKTTGTLVVVAATPKLPPRRQTHWDRLLQEMRWMATDFHEERKWKVAAGRVLVHESLKRQTNTRVLQENSNVPPVVESKTTTALSAGSASSSSSSSTTTATATTTPAPRYTPITPDDEQQAKQVAEKVSQEVTKHVAALWTKPVVVPPKEKNAAAAVVNMTSTTTPETRASLRQTLEQRIQAIESHTGNATTTPLQNDNSSKSDDDNDKNNTTTPTLTAAQRDVWHAMQDWHQFDETGTVLQGTVACGKTVLACALLWKQRHEGLQVVVCAPTRWIRWNHELARWGENEWKIHRMGDTGTDWKSLGPGDVLLCEHSAVQQLVVQNEKTNISEKSRIQSLVIDCRHASAFEGSRPATCLPGAPHTSTAAFRSTEFWSALAKLGAPRRLVLENLTRRNKPPPYVEGLPPKQMLEVLALRNVLLLLGGTKMRSSSISSNDDGKDGARLVPPPTPEITARALLSWARRKVEKKKKKSLLDLVRKLLLSCVEPLHFCLDASQLLDHMPVLWDVRPCEMTKSQEQAYTQCCHQVQSALSRGLGDIRRPELVAKGLLRLRRQCAHAHLSRLQQRHQLLPSRDSPSQTSFDWAKEILEGSCKLQTLVSFLVHECGWNEDLEEHLEPLVVPPVKLIKRKRSANLERIVILAALPELQVVTSVLLSSLGIDHSLVFQQEPQSGEDSSDESSLRIWMEYQAILADFNSEEDSSSRLIVSSVDALASDHGGLSVETADVVVCLDEDWSGRSELLLYSLMARCQQRRERDGTSPCRFVRLVASDSCEMAFLKPSKSNNKSKAPTNEKLPLALHPLGWFDASQSITKDESSGIRECWRNRKVTTSCFVFPARNFLALRDVDLAMVLAADDLPPLLNSQNDPRFLPATPEEDSILTEMAFLAILMTEEMTGRRQQGYLESSLDALAVAFCNATRTPVSSFLRRFASVVDSSSLGTSLQRLNLSVPVAGAAAIPLSKSETDSSDELPTCNSEDSKSFPSSLLFYPSHSSSKTNKKIAAGNGVSGDRTNLYALSFYSMGASTGLPDGNQGTEPLVYFPPLFPRVLESSVLAKNDADLLKSRAGAEAEAKRKRADVERLPTSSHATKRPRPEGMDVARGDLPVDGLPALTTESNQQVAMKETSLLELQEDYGVAGMGAVSLPRDSALSAAYTAVDTMSAPSGADISNEWLAFPGPCDLEEMERMSRETNNSMGSVVLLVSRKRPRGYNGRPGALPMNRPGQGRLASNGAWTGNPPLSKVPSLPNGMMHDTNGSTGGKRMKKKSDGLAQASAFTRFPPVDPTSLPRSGDFVPGTAQAPKTKDLYKKGLLASLRQSGIGSTLFEATAFRAASQRVNNRVESRLIGHCWTSNSAFEVGPGLPLHISKMHNQSPGGRISFEVNPDLWTSIVKRLKSPDSETGLEALELAHKQRSAFRRSLVIPCRVDFGPFQSGFLSAPSGMTAVAPPRFRAGVSLPMGVKISTLLKDQLRPVWKTEDDAALLRALTRYGMNWLLSAFSLRGFEQFRHVHQPDAIVHGASRSCRERWQTLIRDDALQVKKAREADQEHRSVFLQLHDCYENGIEGGRIVKGSLYGSIELPADDEKDYPGGNRGFSLLVPPEIEMEPSFDGSVNPGKGSDPMDIDGAKPKRAKHRKSFAAFDRAKTKIQKNTIPIPGVAAGSPPAVGPPSHPSHMQAVQAATSSGMRAEMWPLQILGTHRKREGTASSSSSGPAATAARSATGSVRPTIKSNSHSNGRTGSASHPVKQGNALPATQQRSAYKNTSKAKETPKMKAPPCSTQPIPSQNRSTMAPQSFAPPPNPIPAQASAPPKKDAPDPQRKPGA